MSSDKYSRNWWLERLPLITAYANGENIQQLISTNKEDFWATIGQFGLSFEDKISNYKIKPVPITAYVIFYKSSERKRIVSGITFNSYTEALEYGNKVFAYGFNIVKVEDNANTY